MLDLFYVHIIKRKKKDSNNHRKQSRLPPIPELLVSHISVPRLFEESVSSGCSMLMFPCFLANRGGILDVMVLFFTGIYSQ